MHWKKTLVRWLWIGLILYIPFTLFCYFFLHHYTLPFAILPIPFALITLIYWSDAYHMKENKVKWILRAIRISIIFIITLLLALSMG